MHDNGYAALLSAVAGTVAEMVKTYSTQEAENNVLQHSYMSHLHTWPSCMCMMKKAQMKTVACRIAYWCKNAFFEDWQAMPVMDEEQLCPRPPCAIHFALA